jgi:hypothetical protein
LDSRTCGVEQPDQWDALGQRKLSQASDLELARHPHRTSHHREVVSGHRDESPVDLAVAGDDAIGRSLLAIHRALRGVGAAMDPELGPRTRVDQELEPLARRQLLSGVLGGDLLAPAALADLRAADLEVLGEGSEEACCWSVGRHVIRSA